VRIKNDLPQSIENYKISVDKLEGLAVQEYDGL
jgi:CRISPR-associated protein Csd2